MARMQESRQDPALAGAQNAANEENSDVVIAKNIAMPRVKSEDRDPADPSTWGKVGRNELCPCGSGKKFKQCHGRVG